MSSHLESIPLLSAQLQQLRTRVAQIEAEKATLLTQIDDCVARIAAATAWQVRPPASAPMSALVLWVLRRNAGRPLAPNDIADILQLRSYDEVANVRLVLSRMARAGKVRRVAHGRYVGLEPPKS
jgi:hypothetical protein